MGNACLPTTVFSVPATGSIAISATDAATMPLPISATRLHRWQWLVLSSLEYFNGHLGQFLAIFGAYGYLWIFYLWIFLDLF